MRQFLALAAVITLTAGAAHAQIQPVQPMKPMAPMAPFGSAGSQTYKPYTERLPPSVYADGPFSPAGEAKRQRQEEAASRARENGYFSPAGEEKRHRAQMKHDAAINPFK